MSIEVLATMAEHEAALKANKYVIIDFYADWCGPCKMIAPKVAALAKEFPNVKFCKVNVDDASEVSESCGITAMPTFIAYKDGAKSAEMKGASEDKLKSMVQELIQ